MNTKRAEHHWDDMLRIAGSLKLGTIQASELIRSLLKSERPSSLALAILDHDAAMLSPLGHKHMNVLGHYYFSLSTTFSSSVDWDSSLQ